jgi:hypothetical protein
LLVRKCGEIRTRRKYETENITHADT